jgi:hypothetical protein
MLPLRVPEWRNWQTRGTQNPERLTSRVGSTPTSGTNSLSMMAHLCDLGFFTDELALTFALTIASWSLPTAVVRSASSTMS